LLLYFNDCHLSLEQLSQALLSFTRGQLYDFAYDFSESLLELFAICGFSEHRALNIIEL